MEKLPCNGCKGLCCGPVPVTAQELKNIKKYIKIMPSKKRSELQKQVRFYGTCIFYDNDKDQCGIHAARPEICKMFGYYKGLVCFRKPEIAKNNLPQKIEKPVGILSHDYKWEYFI